MFVHTGSHFCHLEFSIKAKREYENSEKYNSSGKNTGMRDVLKEKSGKHCQAGSC